MPYPSIYPSQDIHLIAGREPELVILDSGDTIQLVLVLLADVSERDDLALLPRIVTAAKPVARRNPSLLLVDATQHIDEHEVLSRNGGIEHIDTTITSTPTSTPIIPSFTTSTTAAAAIRSS